MKLHLAAIVLLSVSHAFADGGTCANCHTASKAQKNDGFIQDPDAFAFLQDQGSPKPAKTRTCATCHTQPANTSALTPFSFTSKNDQAAIDSWLRAQNGQVDVAPAKDPFAKSIPCKVNCHTPNDPPRPMLAQLSAAGAGFKPMDPDLIRAWINAEGGDRKDARDTPDPNVPVQGDGEPQGGTPPKPDPKDTQTPVSTSEPAPRTTVTPKKTEKDARDQLNQTVADQGSGDDFDGSDNSAAVTPGGDTKPGTAPKKDPAGETYPKPKGPSSKISEVPDSGARGADRSAAQAGDPAPRSGGSGMTGALILGGSAGALFGLGLGGPVGMAVGTAVGAGLGALLSWLF
jgi:hypothetical protein